MLAERLNEVALDVSEFARTTDLLGLLHGLLATVQEFERAGMPEQQSNTERSPSEIREELRETLNKRLTKIQGTLRSAPSNEYRPSEEAILKSMGGWRLTGDRLWDELKAVLAQPAFEEGDVVAQLGKLVEDADDFYGSLDTLLDGFDGLDIDRTTLPVDAAELGFLFPVEMGDAELEDLYKDLEELEKHLRFFAEVVGETPGGVRVRAISSSGWEIFLESPYAQAGLVLFAVDRCLEIIDKGLDVAQKWRDLRDSGTSEDVTDERIEEDVQATTQAEAEELVEDVLTSYEGDEARRNELRTGLRNAVQYLIKQLRRGTKIQVRVVTSPTDPDEEEEEIYPGLGTLSDLEDLGALMSETRSGDRQVAGNGVELIPELTRQLPEDEEAQEENGDEEGEGEADENDATTLDEATDTAEEENSADTDGADGEEEPGRDGNLRDD